MGYVARFKKGSKTLDISSGIYTLSDWIPPRANIISNIASGTSANRYGGGVKVSERAVNTSTVFSVRIKGDSNAECEAGARRIENFLRHAGDEAEPMYLEWRPDNNVSFEPTYGQAGANIRYEIVSGMVDRWNAYFIAEGRNTTMFVNVMLELKPFALGKRQRVATAKGGIVEMVAGNPYGESRGINISQPRTNFCTNPIFGHSTYNTHWSASGTGIVASENTDSDYILYGDSSVKLHSTADDTHYSQSISLTGSVVYTASCYVKMQDSGTPTTDQFKVRMQGGATPSIRQVGDGWWMLYNNFTPGSTASYSCGLQLMDNVTAYLGGMQVEARSIPTPLIHGDQLGASWSGTVHASTSTRGTASLYVPVADSLKFGEFTIRVAFMPEINSSFATTAILFDTSSDNEITGFLNTGTISFRVGANQINSGSLTWGINDKIITHFVAQPGEMKIYYGGTQVASGTAFSLPAPGSNLYIGNDTGEANPINSTIMGFTVFPHAMGSAEVLADYNNVYEAVTGGDGLGQRLDTIPYLWTKDGDNVIDAYDDATHDDWCVVNGVPGNVPAHTILAITQGTTYNYPVAINHYGAERFIKPSNLWTDYSGTARAGAIGGSVEIESIGGAYPGNPTEFSISNDIDLLAGRQVYMWVGLSDAGSTLTIAPGFDLNGNYAFTASEYKSINAGTALRNFLTDRVTFPPDISRYYEWTETQQVRAYPYLKRLSGTADVSVDFMRLLFDNLLYIHRNGAYSSAQSVLIDGLNVYDAGTVLVSMGFARGDKIELIPKQYNHISIIYPLGSNTNLYETANTWTFSRVYVTPRWSLA